MVLICHAWMNCKSVVAKTLSGEALFPAINGSPEQLNSKILSVFASCFFKYLLESSFLHLLTHSATHDSIWFVCVCVYDAAKRLCACPMETGVWLIILGESYCPVARQAHIGIKTEVKGKWKRWTEKEIIKSYLQRLSFLTGSQTSCRDQ